ALLLSDLAFHGVLGLTSRRQPGHVAEVLPGLPVTVGFERVGVIVLKNLGVGVLYILGSYPAFSVTGAKRDSLRVVDEGIHDGHEILLPEGFIVLRQRAADFFYHLGVSFRFH